MATQVETLCKGYPAEFSMYLNYCRGLRFDEPPDYTYLRQLFRILVRTLGLKFDYLFDWTLLKQQSAAKAASSSKNGREGENGAQGFSGTGDEGKVTTSAKPSASAHR